MKKTQNQFCISEYRFFIFNSQETAQAARTFDLVLDDGGKGNKYNTAFAIHEQYKPFGTKKYWEDVTKEKVLFSEANVPILVLERIGMFWHVIIGDKFGWIYVDSNSKDITRLKDFESE